LPLSAIQKSRSLGRVRETCTVLRSFLGLGSSIRYPSYLASFAHLRQLFLDEQQRRGLHLLASQHQRWAEGTAKFIAAYGEGLIESMDFENYEALNSALHVSESMRSLMRAEQAVEVEFENMSDTFANLLQPLLGIGSEIDHFIESVQFHVQSLATAPPVSSRAAAPAVPVPAASSVPGSPPAHHLILLVSDEILQSLPFEALPLVQSRFHGHLSRDFSLNVLANRLRSLSATDPSDRIQVQPSQVLCLVDPFGDDPTKEVNAAVQPLPSEGTDKATEVAGAAETAEKKGAKASKAAPVAPSLAPQASAPSAPTAPYSGERLSMVQVANKLQQTQPGAGKWVNIVTADKRGRGVALQDWISLSSREGTPSFEKALFVYTPGKFFGTLMNPKELCNLNLRGVSLLVISDWTQTDLSFRRQLTLESKKSVEELSLETPLVCNALCSLTGIGCTVSSLWSTTPSATEKHTVAFWKEFARGNHSVAQAVSRGRGLEIDVASHRMMHEVGLTGGGGSGIAEPEPTESSRRLMRKWVRFSRVVYGLPNIFYHPS
jgi:hypothetical protein